MILKLKMKDASRKNIETIKLHFFDDSDRITAGYIIGLAVERTKKISDIEWENAVKSVLYPNDTSGKSTSVSLRQEIFERLAQIKEKLEGLNGRSLYMSQVIDVVLFIVAKKLNPTMIDSDSLLVLEWNLNARSSGISYSVPVNLISNEVLEKNPHIFIFTEFVKSVGWLDLKTVLGEKYYIYDSPYLPRQNGICIGIRKECGIEYLGDQSKSMVFAAHLNAPDFYEIRVRIKSEIFSVIGTRIRIDCHKAQQGTYEEKLAEQKQRFEQYTNLMNYVAKLDNVIVMGDFNNSRVLSNELECSEKDINQIYAGKVSIEHNFQKMNSFAIRKSNGKVSMYTPSGDLSSVGAVWDSAAKKAKAPNQNKDAKHKYDHVLTSYILERMVYKWDYLRFYDEKQFTTDGKIKVGYPDHAILLATINLFPINHDSKEEFYDKI